MTKIEKQVNFYLDYCENAMKLSRWTMITKRSVYKRFINNSNCKNFFTFDVRDYNQWIKLSLEDKTPQNVNNHIKELKAMASFYERMGNDLKMKPKMYQKIKCEKKERVFYTKEVIEKVIEDDKDMVSKVMNSIAFDTGMRLNEVRNIRCCDIKQDRISYIGKGGKHRVAYIRPTTVRLVKRYIHDYDIVTYLFAEKKKVKPLSCTAVSKHMRKPFYKAGFKDFYPHALRHSFATDLQRQGAKVEEIQQLLGHSSVTTTEMYLHGFTDLGMKELAQKYH